MGDLLLRPHLLRRGVTDADVRRAVRTERWRRLRPGAYLERTDPRWRDAAARHAALVEATIPQLADGAVLSGVSAAVRHGLPLWGVPLDRVEVTRAGRSGGRGGHRTRTRVAPLPDQDLVVVDGLSTTSVARTVVDLARTTPFETAVTACDAALHGRLVTGDELTAAVLAALGRHGVARARAVLAFADARADGPGESRSRVRMDRHGIAPPVLQHAISDADGEYVGRVDFWWPRAGVVGEFDGLEKYGRSRRAGESPGDAVVREKRREDALRAQPGVRRVVRWTWAEIDDFAALATRLPRAADEEVSAGQRRPRSPASSVTARSRA